MLTDVVWLSKIYAVGKMMASWPIRFNYDFRQKLALQFVTSVGLLKASARKSSAKKFN